MATPTASPHIRKTCPPVPPRGLIILLHGGAERSTQQVNALRPAWQQVLRIQRAIAERTNDAGIAVWAVRHAVAGWNDNSDPDPVQDARKTISAVRLAFGDLPIVLTGHSMGGRTAVRAADDPSVVGVVGLAPWLPDQESVQPLAGKHLRVAHARLDWISPVSEMQPFLNRAKSVTASYQVHDLGHDIHSMVFGSRWHEFTLTQTLELLRSAQ